MEGTSRHVVGYLQDFLFSPDQIQAPVRLLSGGERNRLLLAKLFSVPSNVLVLDEPTNDLDTETLSLLEERLLTYSGTILLVSHDRAFLNNVVTSTLVFEGDGRLREYVGGYDDWLRQRRKRPAPGGRWRRQEGGTDRGGSARTGARSGSAARAGAAPAAEAQELSFKETKELEALPQRIDALEEERTEIIAALSSSEFYAANDSGQVAATNARLEALELDLAEAYSRWEILEGLGG